MCSACIKDIHPKINLFLVQGQTDGCGGRMVQPVGGSIQPACLNPEEDPESLALQTLLLPSLGGASQEPAALIDFTLASPVLPK